MKPFLPMLYRLGLLGLLSAISTLVLDEYQWSRFTAGLLFYAALIFFQFYPREKV